MPDNQSASEAVLKTTFSRENVNGEGVVDSDQAKEVVVIETPPVTVLEEKGAGGI